MPITEGEFNEGYAMSDLEKAILGFLRSHPGQAFTQSEITTGIGYKSENLLDAIAVGLGIGGSINNLIQRKKIIGKHVNFSDYYMAAK